MFETNLNQCVVYGYKRADEEALKLQDSYVNYHPKMALDGSIAYWRQYWPSRILTISKPSMVYLDRLLTTIHPGERAALSPTSTLLLSSLSTSLPPFVQNHLLSYIGSATETRCLAIGLPKPPVASTAEPLY